MRRLHRRRRPPPNRTQRRPRRHRLLPRIPLPRRILPQTPLLGQRLQARTRPLHRRSRRRRRLAPQARARLHAGRQVRAAGAQVARAQQDPPHRVDGARRDRVRALRLRQHGARRPDDPAARGRVLGAPQPRPAPRGRARVPRHVPRVPAVRLRRAEPGARRQGEAQPARRARRRRRGRRAARRRGGEQRERERRAEEREEEGEGQPWLRISFLIWRCVFEGMEGRFHADLRAFRFARAYLFQHQRVGNGTVPRRRKSKGRRRSITTRMAVAWAGARDVEGSLFHRIWLASRLGLRYITFEGGNEARSGILK